MNASKPMDEVSVLTLSLHGRRVGYLAGYRNGRNVLSFADDFRHDPARPTFSLITHPGFPKAQAVMSSPWVRNQRLHPALSNLLPEGSLRELLAQGLKTHVDNEFQLLAHLGQDLPGALVATPTEPQDVPAYVLATHGQAQAVSFNAGRQARKFSLAGVQMKFSMKENDGRYNFSEGELGDWIIKTPSTQHEYVPLNEFTAMSLAALAGIDIPEIRLVEMNNLAQLPQIKLPDEQFAFAIKRFDRSGGERVHMEDFAQVLVKYPYEKYNTANYEQVANVLYDYSADGLADAQQFARRLLVNILLANGDAHLKNWSLLYQDQINPRLSPAYDIVTTRVYIENEQEYALNLGKTKRWLAVTMANFKAWAEKSGIPWRAINPHLLDTMETARDIWPQALQDLPMSEPHKLSLKQHWRSLQPDFRIETD
ncbi:MAG: type II toxin-antitoxin system HipA family toxin [Gammaproteobacteria bacterium]